MHQADPDLPALITSRICHDLASPLMAIANGLELMEMSGMPGTPESALVADGVKSARARMEFFRIAFGAADAEQMLSGAGCAAVLTDRFAERRIAVTLDIGADAGIARAGAKLCCLMALCAETAMPRGGTVRLTPAGRGGWRLLAEADRIKDVAQLWDVLNGAPGAVGAADVHFPLARLTAQQQNLTLRATPSATGVVIEAA